MVVKYIPPNPQWVNDGVNTFEETDIYRYDVDNTPLYDLINDVYWLKNQTDAKNCYVSNSDPAGGSTLSIPPPAIWIRPDGENRDIFVRENHGTTENPVYRWVLFRKRLLVGRWLKGCAVLIADIPATYSSNDWVYDFGDTDTKQLKLYLGKNTGSPIPNFTIVFDETFFGGSSVKSVSSICKQINSVIDNDQELTFADNNTGWQRGGCSWVWKKDSSGNYKVYLAIFTRIPSVCDLSVPEVVVPLAYATDDVDSGYEPSYSVFFSGEEKSVLGSENPIEHQDMFIVDYFNENLTDEENNMLNRGIFQYRQFRQDYGEIVNFLAEIMPAHSSTHNPSGIDPLETDTPVAVEVSTGVILPTEGSAEAFARSDHQHTILNVQGTAWGDPSDRDGALTSTQYNNIMEEIELMSGGSKPFENNPDNLVEIKNTTKSLGSLDTLVRADHQHGVEVGLLADIQKIEVTDTSTGSSERLALADHQHGVEVWDVGEGGSPADIVIGGTPSAGISTKLIRSDHNHSINPAELSQSLQMLGYYKIYIGYYSYTISQFNHNGTPFNIPLPQGWSTILGVWLQHHIVSISQTQNINIVGGVDNPVFVSPEVTEIDTSAQGWCFKMRIRSRGILCSLRVQYLIIGY